MNNLTFVNNFTIVNNFTNAHKFYDYKQFEKTFEKKCKCKYLPGCIIQRWQEFPWYPISHLDIIKGQPTRH